MSEYKEEQPPRGKFTLLDVWFHIGVGINLIVVFLLMWYAVT